MFDVAFEKLKNMKECLALELTDNTGEPLFYFEKNKDFEIKKISKSMNAVLQGVHETSATYHLGGVKYIQVDSSEYSMFSVCSGETERIHIHLFVVFSLNSNISLAKIAMDDAIAQALVLANT